ncbi:MAG: hypothetical protein ACFE0R_18760 [Salinarimonas sp.]
MPVPTTHPILNRPHLVVPGVPAAARSLTAAFSVLSANARLILGQPDLSLTILPTLPEDQALLRLHVEEYQRGDDLSAGILATLQALVTIAEQVQNLGGALLPTARTLDTSDPSSPDYAESLATWRSVLSTLSRATTSLDPDSHSTALTVSANVDALAAFLQNQIADDAARFAAAVRQAAQSNDIRSLSLQISALQGQIDDIDQEIAKGATTEIVPALKFGFSIAKTAFTATEFGPLALAVGFDIKDEVGEITEFGKEMEARNQELDDLIVQYETLVASLIDEVQQMAVLLTIQGDLTVFASNLREARDVAQRLLGATQLLGQGIAILEAVDVPPGPAWFEEQLDAGIEAWGRIAQLCEAQLRLARRLGG